MSSSRRVALTLVAVLFVLALPAAAAAAVYEVNTTADETDKAPGAPCETDAGAGACSLRAAIEVANSTAAVADEIKFAADPFNGESGDTISAATALPTITDQLSIKGGSCDTAAGVKGPCAGAIRAGGGLLLVVEDDDVEIQGLALTGATTAVSVVSASEGFVARGNWIGFDFTGVASGNGTGILIGPDSDGATIGGPDAAERNVIGGSVFVGLDLEGASEATIQGNYFGVTPAGDAAAANSKGIEITDSISGSGAKAEDNEVGATLSVGATASAACDGGCNVVAGSTNTGIDLNGEFGIQNEAPASGPTIVHGNFVGLDADGDGVLGNSVYGINGGSADDVVVGGEPSTSSNLIAGGQYGISHENGEEVEVRGNVIGEDATGAAATPPSSYGIHVLTQLPTAAPVLAENQIRMGGGVGIVNRSLGAEILGNIVTGGNRGIQVYSNIAGADNLIEGNAVRDTTSSGIVIENGPNEVFGNEIEDAGYAGIYLAGEADENRIGGDTPGSENVIEGSAVGAILLVLPPEPQNEVARNRGAGNGNGFIGLLKINSEEPAPNGEIQPPAIAFALQSSADGTALPGARVRVFRKASKEPGELQSFLGEVVADEGGNWKATYPSVPVGTRVTATQTNTLGGTSELATPVTVTDPSGGAGNNAGPTPDTTAPKTTITKAPKAKSTSTTAKFKFKSNEPGSKFQCKLDKGKFKSCKSPKTYKKLKPGKHVFKVRATDKAGNVGKPAKRTFTVVAG